MINPWSNAATADEAATGAGVGDFTLPDNRIVVIDSLIAVL